MSKRSRGSRRTTARPGTRPPKDRSVRPAQRPSRLVEARVVAEDVVEETGPAVTSEHIADAAASRAGSRARQRTGSALAAKAATEYVYVAQDLRRIVAVAAVLFGIMLVLWVLIVVVRIIPI